MTVKDMGTTGVSIQHKGASAVITLVRPERSNSYTQEMLAQVQDCVEKAEADSSVRAIVITGAGERAARLRTATGDRCCRYAVRRYLNACAKVAK
jgi:1,4-dihydroxy-2-naphthoyl-CoA synthase